jgi:hypothetical protein
MPRRKSIVNVIRDMVRDEVNSAIQSLFGGATKPKNGRRRRRRGRGGPGRSPGSKNKAR